MKQFILLKKQNIKNRGFSLIELLLVLGIIAALAITAFMVFPKVSSANKAQTEINNIYTIKAGINNLFSAVPDYNGLNNELAIQAKIFPEKMIVGPKKAVNIFNGEVIVMADTAGWGHVATQNSDFAITYNSIPDAECVKIVSAIAPEFYSITVNGEYIKNKGGEFNITDLAKACKEGRNSNKIMLIGL